MSSEENKAIYRRIIEEVFNQGNLDVADEIFDKNFIELVPLNFKCAVYHSL